MHSWTYLLGHQSGAMTAFSSRLASLDFPGVAVVAVVGCCVSEGPVSVGTVMARSSFCDVIMCGILLGLPGQGRSQPQTCAFYSPTLPLTLAAMYDPVWPLVQVMPLEQ